MKKKILILSGGISKERLISLDTGKQVAKELIKNGYKVLISEPDKNLSKNITLFKPDIIFKYRNNDLPDDIIFLSASFKGEKKDRDIIQKKVNELKTRKDSNQPTKIKTSGSTFKNPINQSDKKVWQLIKESVPLDTSFGDACISDKHCNFFVNKNNASFDDMNKLIKFVQDMVQKKTGIILEKEIKILE